MSVEIDSFCNERLDNSSHKRTKSCKQDRRILCDLSSGNESILKNKTLATLYHKDGEIYYKGEAVNNVPFGKGVIFHHNGILEYQGQF